MKNDCLGFNINMLEDYILFFILSVPVWTVQLGKLGYVRQGRHTEIQHCHLVVKSKTTSRDSIDSFRASFSRTYKKAEMPTNFSLLLNYTHTHTHTPVKQQGPVSPGPGIGQKEQQTCSSGSPSLLTETDRVCLFAQPLSYAAPTEPAEMPPTDSRERGTFSMCYSTITQDYITTLFS